MHWAPGYLPSASYYFFVRQHSQIKGNVISVLCSIENLEILRYTLDIFCGVKENYEKQQLRILR